MKGGCGESPLARDACRVCRVEVGGNKMVVGIMCL